MSSGQPGAMWGIYNKKESVDRPLLRKLPHWKATPFKTTPFFST